MKKNKKKILLNKNALVTGSNRGIGKKIVEKFLENGANVICAVRKKNNNFNNFIKEKEKKFKRKIIVLEFDLLNEDKIISSIKKLYNKNISLDILVNNAATAYGSLTEMTSSQTLRDIFQINYFSQIRIIQLCLRLLKKSKNGSIINIGSMSGVNAIRGSLAYGGSKSALMFSTKVMAKDFSSYKIRVNSIAPGAINTDMLKKMDKNSLKNLLKSSKIKKPLNINIIANKVLFLASNNSLHINGEIIKILKND